MSPLSLLQKYPASISTHKHSASDYCAWRQLLLRATDSKLQLGPHREGTLAGHGDLGMLQGGSA